MLLLTPPQLIDNATAATTEIDTVQNGMKYDYVDIYLITGAMDIGITALKVTESDTSGSGHADIPGATFASALPGATDDNKIWHFGLDCRGRKRYLDLNFTCGDGTAGVYCCAIALLSRAHESPNTAAKRGFAGEILM
jgi:hypothetical protein